MPQITTHCRVSSASEKTHRCQRWFTFANIQWRRRFTQAVPLNHRYRPGKTAGSQLRHTPSSSAPRSYLCPRTPRRRTSLDVSVEEESARSGSCFASHHRGYNPPCNIATKSVMVCKLYKQRTRYDLLRMCLRVDIPTFATHTPCSSSLAPRI